MLLSTELTVKTQKRKISITISEIHSERMKGKSQKLKENL